MGKTVPKFLFASMFFSQTVFPIMVNNLFFSAGLFFSHFTTNVAVKKITDHDLHGKKLDQF